MNYAILKETYQNIQQILFYTLSWMIGERIFLYMNNKPFDGLTQDCIGIIFLVSGVIVYTYVKCKYLQSKEKKSTLLMLTIGLGFFNSPHGMFHRSVNCIQL